MEVQGVSAYIVISLTILSVVVGILTLLIIVKTVDLWRFTRNVQKLSVFEVREAVQDIRRKYERQFQESMTETASQVQEPQLSDVSKEEEKEVE